jgi:integrase
MATVAEQSERFLAELANRKRRAVKPALRNWIIPYLGTMELADIENGVMKKFVNLLVDQRLSPATICGAVTTLKMLVGSETDENGSTLNQREWNAASLDLPVVDPASQRAPIIRGRELNAALSKADKPYQAYYALAAATGCRMGEMLALKMGPDLGNGSVLDLVQGIVFVRTALYDRREQSTKSLAGVRGVDLCASLVTWLNEAFNAKQAGERIFTTDKGSIWHLATLYDHFRWDGIPGSNSLRRFRTTHLENMSVPRVLVDYWTGRASKTITGIGARKDWCQRAGLGFQLPRIT